MKLVISFLFLAGSALAFGQSAKKVNKQLLKQFALEQQKQDSAYKVFQHSKQEYDSVRAAINAKTDLLVRREETAKIVLFSVHELTRSLSELEVDPDFLKNNSGIDQIPRYRELTRPVKEILKTEVSFNKVSSRLYLDGVKLKEQNVLLADKIKEYQDYSKYNYERQQELESNKAKLDAFSPKLDSLSMVYQLLADKLNEQKTALFSKWAEVRTNYVNKGPKGFPDAYRRIFWDVFPPEQKEFPPVQEELVRESGEVTIAGYTDDALVPEPPVEREAPEIYTMVDEPASFPGGLENMRTYISKNLRYPQIASESGISGKVYVKFIVAETGEISNVTLLKGISGCKECDMEAIRLVKGMPDWIPGKNNGKAVKSYFNLPVVFKLD